jgi:hypothetical protein
MEVWQRGKAYILDDLHFKSTQIAEKERKTFSLMNQTELDRFVVQGAQM